MRTDRVDKSKESTAETAGSVAVAGKSPFLQFLAVSRHVWLRLFRGCRCSGFPVSRRRLAPPSSSVARMPHRTRETVGLPFKVSRPALSSWDHEEAKCSRRSSPAANANRKDFRANDDAASCPCIYLLLTQRRRRRRLWCHRGAGRKARITERDELGEGDDGQDSETGIVLLVRADHVGPDARNRFCVIKCIYILCVPWSSEAAVGCCD